MIKVPKRVTPSPGWKPKCDHDECYEFWWSELRSCFWHYPHRLTCLKSTYKLKWMQLTPMKTVESATKPTYFRFTVNKERVYAGTSAQMFEHAIDAFAEPYGAELWLGQDCSDHFSTLKKARTKSLCGYLRVRVLWERIWHLAHASMAVALRSLSEPMNARFLDLIDLKHRFEKNTIQASEIDGVLKHMNDIGQDHKDWGIYLIATRYLAISNVSRDQMACSRDFFQAIRAHSPTATKFVNENAVDFAAAELGAIRLLAEKRFEMARTYLKNLRSRPAEPAVSSGVAAQPLENSP